MANDNRAYTVLIFPNSTSKVRQLSIHSNLIRGAAACAILVVAVLVYGAVRIGQHEALNLKYLSVKSRASNKPMTHIRILMQG